MNVHDLSAIHKRVEAGESLAVIARELGVRPDTLHKQYRRVYGPIGWRGRSRHGITTKIVTEAILAECEFRVRGGEALYAIAKEKGIVPVTLQRAYERSGRPNPNPPGQRPGNRTHLTHEAEEALTNWEEDAKGGDAMNRIIATLALVDRGVSLPEIRARDAQTWKRRDLRD